MLRTASQDEADAAMRPPKRIRSGKSVEATNLVSAFKLALQRLV
jgi:hypothetical protein